MSRQAEIVMTTTQETWQKTRAPFRTGARVSMLPISRPPFEPPWVPSVLAVPAPYTHTHTHRAARPNPIHDNKVIAFQRNFRKNRRIIVHIVIIVYILLSVGLRTDAACDKILPHGNEIIVGLAAVLTQR